jgi:hypothetical protein
MPIELTCLNAALSQWLKTPDAPICEISPNWADVTPQQRPGDRRLSTEGYHDAFQDPAFLRTICLIVPGVDIALVDRPARFVPGSRPGALASSCQSLLRIQAPSKNGLSA